MALADLATLGKRRDKLAREVRANPKMAPQPRRARQRLIAALEEGTVPARSLSAGSLEARSRASVSADRQADALRRQRRRSADHGTPGPMAQAVVRPHAKAENSRAIAFSGKIEAEFAGL
jgi:aminoglycoside phosphotransferase family enzyme